MRERWLFLLLCAFLAQLSYSDHHVDNGGKRLNKIRPDLSTEPSFYGEEIMNGAEFTSGMEKIRRARSTADELTKAEQQWKTAVEEHDALEKALTEANDAVTKAADDKKNAQEKWEAADKNLTEIKRNLTKAVEDANRAEETWSTESTNQTNKERLSTAATSEHANASKKWKILDKKTNQLAEIHKVSKAAFDEAVKNESKAGIDAKYSLESLERANRKVNQLETSWNNSKPILADAVKRLADINSAIQLKENYMAIKREREAKETKKKKYTEANGLLEIANAKKSKMENRKSKIDNNMVMHNEIDWKSRTVEEAIQFQSELYDNYTSKIEELKNGNSTDTTEIENNKRDQESAKTLKGSLEELKSLGLTGKVMDLKKKLPELKQNASKEFIAANKEVTRLTEEKNNIEQEINNINQRLTTAAKGKAENVILHESSIAEREKNDAVGEVESANQTTISFFDKYNEKKEEVKSLKESLRIANELWQTKINVTEVANTTATEAFLNFTNAQNESTTFKNEVLDPAKAAMDTAQGNFNASKIISSAASVAKTTADGVKKRNVNLEKEANKTEIDKRNERDSTARILETKNNLALEALNAQQQKKNEVNDLKKMFDDWTDKDNLEKIKEAEEKKANEERKKTIAVLSTGLGSAIGILVLMAIGGVLAFVLIRRKKKAAKDKKPTKEVIESEDGLTVYKRKGVPDQYVVEGKDINVRGPLPRTDIDKMDVPLKHKLDDQVGGDTIDKITFDKKQYEAFYIGEGIDIQLAEQDSVEQSESTEYKRGENNCYERYLAEPAEGDAVAPSSTKFLKEQDQKPNSKKSSKSKRAKGSNPKNPPSSTPSDEQDKKKN